MNKDVIKKVIIEKQEEISQVKLLHRAIGLESRCNYVFVGMRRAGKSYLMFQHIQSLIESGEHSIDDVLYINFEDERLAHLKAEELGGILECYEELYHQRPLIYLDEIQNITGWEKFARRLADSKYQVFVTGSNAQMLSRDIASTLGGRFIVKEVYPFSFQEFLEIKGVELKKNWAYSSVKNDVIKMWQSYLRFGGLAECFELQDKMSWLTSLYLKILLGDIVTRNAIRNPEAIRVLAKKLAESVMQPSTQSRLQHVVSSAGTKITRNTIVEYVGHMRDAYLIFGLPNYTAHLSERESAQKRYFYDNGLLNIFLIDGESKLLENAAAIGLVRRYGLEQVFYYQKGIEVDFYLPSEGMAIQVCYSMADDATKERECKALRKLHHTFPLKRAIILTSDEEGAVEYDGLSIELIPMWKWELSQQV